MDYSEVTHKKLNYCVSLRVFRIKGTHSMSTESKRDFADSPMLGTKSPESCLHNRQWRTKRGGGGGSTLSDSLMGGCHIGS